MIIIETCPICGSDLVDLMIATYPPVPKKQCPSCGWSSEGKQDKIVRVPYPCGNILREQQEFLPKSIHCQPDQSFMPFNSLACQNCSNNPANGGSGICHCTLGLPKIT